MASVIKTEGNVEVTRNSLGEWTIHRLGGLTMKLTSTDEAIRHLVESFSLSNRSAKKVVSSILKVS